MQADVWSASVFFKTIFYIFYDLYINLWYNIK